MDHFMTYDEIKRKAKVEDIARWKIALQAGIGEATLCRWFRVPETPERLARVSDALEALLKEKTYNGE